MKMLIIYIAVQLGMNFGGFSAALCSYSYCKIWANDNTIHFKILTLNWVLYWVDIVHSGIYNQVLLYVRPNTIMQTTDC